jgi:hypothetical protein
MVELLGGFDSAQTPNNSIAFLYEKMIQPKPMSYTVEPNNQTTILSYQVKS